MSDYLCHVAAKALIYDERDRVLLVHKISDPDEFWTPPGGRVNKGESLGDTLVREVKEEINLDVDTWRLVHAEMLPPERCKLEGGGVFIFYKAWVEDIRKIKLGPELDEYQWFEVDDILGRPELTGPEVIDAITRSMYN